MRSFPEFVVMDQSSRLKDSIFICIILLLLESVYPISADSMLTADVASTIKVANMSFSSKLSNPCSLIDPSPLDRQNLNVTDEKTLRETVSYLRFRAPFIKAEAESVLESHVLGDCTNLTLPPVARIPAVEDKTLHAVLSHFYTSILNHTAHVYLISENLQPHSHDSSCETLHGKTETLISQMKDILCQLRLLILEIPKDTEEDIFQISEQQILNEEFSHQPICSRRLVKDCQTVHSTISLMTAFQNFLQTTVYFEDPTTIYYDETTIFL